MDIFTTMSDFLTRIVLALMILLIGFVLGKVGGRLVFHFLHEAELDRLLKKARAGVSLERSFSRLAEYFINFITIILAVNQLGVGEYVLSGLAIVLFIVVGLSFLLALKDIIPNFFAGLFILKRGKVKKGDKVKVHGVEGTITSIDLFETHVKTRKGETLQIPNSLLEKEVVVKRK